RGRNARAPPADALGARGPHARRGCARAGRSPGPRRPRAAPALRLGRSERRGQDRSRARARARVGPPARRRSRRAGGHGPGACGRALTARVWAFVSGLLDSVLSRERGLLGMSIVGRSTPRAEGPDKLCGRARYLDDHVLPGALHAVTLRSTIAHGRIEGIDFDPAFPWHECVVADARDIPAGNHVSLMENDQPLLADGRVLHPMEPILLVGHPVRAKAYQALAHVRVRYAELPPVYTVEEALALGQVLRAPDNVFKSFCIEKGDVEAGLANADVVVEGEYRVPHQEQAYIENQAMAATVEDDGTLVVMGSMQCPFYVHKALLGVFGLPPEKIRVVQTTTGGAFGGKEE